MLKRKVNKNRRSAHHKGVWEGDRTFAPSILNVSPAEANGCRHTPAALYTANQILLRIE